LDALKTTTLDRFRRTVDDIVIDDSGWGDLLLGVVVGGLKLSSGRYMARRIPVTFFQPPLFERKVYLEKAVEIVRKMIGVMRADKYTRFKVCSGYVLSAVRAYLNENGYNLVEVEVTGEPQEMVERSYVKWCVEMGVPAKVLDPESGRKRFMALLQWVSEDPKVREQLVKTGWKSWQKRWRKIAYNQSHKRTAPSNIQL
jgi:hypothetical protein